MKKLIATIVLICMFGIVGVAGAQTYTPGNFWKQLGQTIYLQSTSWILSVNNYLNFGGTTGSSGFGLRSNSGTMQFKNNGGSWIDIGTGGGGIETLSNVGGGVEVVYQVDGSDGQFRTFNGTGGIDVIQSGEVIEIDGSGIEVGNPFDQDLNTTDAVQFIGVSTTNATSSNLSVTSILPINGSSSIGSVSNPFQDIFVNTLHASTTQIDNTTEGDLVVNSDNSSADTESSYLIFDRGSVSPNAIFGWNATNQYLETNQDLFISGNATSTFFATSQLCLNNDCITEWNFDDTFATSTFANSTRLVWAATQMTNSSMPAEDRIWLNSATYYKKASLTNAYRFRTIRAMGTAGPAGSTIRLQYSTDKTNWFNAGQNANDTCTLVGTASTPCNWTTLVQGARGDVWLRYVTNGGTGTSPTFRDLTTEFQVYATTDSPNATTTQSIVFSLPATYQQWNNIPSAASGGNYVNFSSATYNKITNFDKANKYRIIYAVSTTTNAVNTPDPGTTIDVQYSYDNTNFFNLNSGTASPATGSGQIDISAQPYNELIAGNWVDIAEGGKGAVWLRFVAYGGNGVNDIRFNYLGIEVETQLQAEAFDSGLWVYDTFWDLDGITTTSTQALWFQGPIFASSTAQLSDVVMNGNATTTGSMHASEFCIANDCITLWPTGGGGGNPFNQQLDTTNTPEFFGLTMNTNSSFATTTIGDLNNYITFGRTTYTGGLGVLDFPTIEFTSTGNPLAENLGGVKRGFGIFGTDADNPTLAFFPGDFADSGDIALMQYASGTGVFLLNDASSSGNLFFGTVGSVFASNSFLIGTTTTSTPYGLLVENKNIRNQSTNNYGLGDYTTAFETGLITEVPFFGTQQVANYAISTSTDDTNNTSTVGIIGAGKSGGVYGLGRQIGAAGVLEDRYITVGILGNKLNDHTRVGVYGLSPSATSTGTNVGVRGQASSGLLNYGLFGLATGNTGTKYGVFASTTGTGINYAGYFAGDVFVTNGGVTSTESIHSPEFCLAGNCITSWAATSPWTSYANGLYYNGGTVAIGTTTPDTSAGLVVASTTAQVGIQSIGTTFGGYFQGGTYGAFAIGDSIGLFASSTVGVAGKGSVYGVSGTLNDDSGAVGYLGLHRYTNQGLYGTGGVYGEVDNATTTGVNIGLVGYADGGLYNYAGYFAGGDVFVNDNLGIGTSTPFSKLSVIGDIYSEANRNVGDFNFSTIGRTSALVENLFDPGSGENWYVGSYISATSTEYDQASTTIGIYGNGQTVGIVGYGQNVGLVGAGQQQGGLFVCTDPNCTAVNAQGNLGVSGNSLVGGNSTTTGLTVLGAGLFDIGSFTVGTVEDGVASSTQPRIEIGVLDLPALGGFGVQVPLINAKVCSDALGFCPINGLGALNALFVGEDTSAGDSNPVLSFSNFDGSDTSSIEYNTTSDKFVFFDVSQVDFYSPLLIATSSPWLVFTETGGNNAAIQYVESGDQLRFSNASYFFDNDVTIADLPAVGNDPLCWDGSGESQIGDCTSLAKYKTNITDLSSGLLDILKLKPRSFDWQRNADGSLATSSPATLDHDTGFIAEEAEQANAGFARYDQDGELQGINETGILAAVVNAIQDLFAKITGLESKVNELEQKAEKIDLLERRLEELEKQINNNPVSIQPLLYTPAPARR